MCFICKLKWCGVLQYFKWYYDIFAHFTAFVLCLFLFHTFVISRIQQNLYWVRVVSWIIKIVFFFFYEAEFPKFHSYLNFQSFRGAWLALCTSWPSLFQVYSRFSCGSVAIPAVQGITHSFNFFASSASVWAWCNRSHLIPFDLHQALPVWSLQELQPGSALQGLAIPLSPTDPSPLLHPDIICWASLLFPSTLNSCAKIYWRASVAKSGEYIFILVEIKLWLELHF